METSALHSQIAVFEAEDNCLYFALGLAHIAHTVSLALESEAGLAASEEDELVYFSLGLQSFFNRYLKALAAYQAGPPPETELRPPPNGQALPRLAIRELLL